MDRQIWRLWEKDFAAEYFEKNILPLYPNFSRIKKIKISPRKDQIMHEYYHVVVEYAVTFIDKKGKKKNLPIYCTAHSNEPRNKVFDNLKFLWANGFGYRDLTIPKPLLYDEFFNATFYRGSEGHNLYYYIKKNDCNKINTIIPKTARWFSRLHRIPTDDLKDFNLEESRIKTVVPGADKILSLIKDRFPDSWESYAGVYELLSEREEKFLSNAGKKWIVHGDAHPENIIRQGKKKICVIDFTDLCLSDFARDLGSFTQQLDFMIGKRFADKEYANKVKKLFLDNYYRYSKITPDASLEERIKIYYCWTQIRTATYFLLKHDPQPHRAAQMLEETVRLLDIK